MIKLGATQKETRKERRKGRERSSTGAQPHEFERYLRCFLKCNSESYVCAIVNKDGLSQASWGFIMSHTKNSEDLGRGEYEMSKEGVEDARF